jgi:hypothetical protein
MLHAFFEFFKPFCYILLLWVSSFWTPPPPQRSGKPSLNAWVEVLVLT